MTPKAEQDARERETIIQWDALNEKLWVWTADIRVMKKWQKAGWPTEVFGLDRDGKARSWQTNGVPSDRVVFLKVPKKKPVN